MYVYVVISAGVMNSEFYTCARASMHAQIGIGSSSYVAAAFINQLGAYLTTLTTVPYSIHRAAFHFAKSFSKIRQEEIEHIKFSKISTSVVVGQQFDRPGSQISSLHAQQATLSDLSVRRVESGLTQVLHFDHTGYGVCHFQLYICISYACVYLRVPCRPCSEAPLQTPTSTCSIQHGCQIDHI